MTVKSLREETTHFNSTHLTKPPQARVCLLYQSSNFRESTLFVLRPPSNLTYVSTPTNIAFETEPVSVSSNKTKNTNQT